MNKQHPILLFVILALLGTGPYGLRRTEKPVTSWNDRMEDWLRLKGFLEK